MTCLGKLVFADKYSRQSSTANDSSEGQVNSLSLAYEDLFTVPYNIIRDFSFTLCHLDISHNLFSRNLQFLSEFENLTSLNLDHNMIDDVTVFPYMPNLELLWLNHNRIINLFPFIKNLYSSVPNLKYLCLMGNMAAPSYLNGGSFYEYLNYRMFVLSWFPYLIHLDDRLVTEEQRVEAKRLYKRPILENIFTLPERMKDIHFRMAFPKLLPLDGQRKPRESNSII
ncbi:leucine-rich melanocyte differentiation-associated protein-like isoform X2 [Linepithema humile]|nr:PREDICTED: leucine-rich repeat-containing protein C10orf11-like isoform X2 [Linepithema humile]XP_012227202.1 PREDICTED: leucine-rich repeat-containing protein C10orf11-like isoform X2 [Linepithema humile]XP_012227203.1 PREDICTED: leucine-rich repeat-containing protein C10orf11-like isoform X2 [Linepithema humile]XP_012227204.1 PREDICTED: leucine-rich repeat-containing protein C10orf11-like isoform X2 [Linepithema humile]XP_012227205.1 PREDICTED: leucine-rich repeat-containing protein C10orf